MKKSLIAAGIIIGTSLALSAVVFPAHAQCGGKRGMMQERMAQSLNLTDKQQDQFKQIHRDARDQMQSIRDAMQDNRDALRKLDPTAKDYMKQVDKLAAEKGSLVESMVRTRAKTRAEIAAILTPDQRARMSELRKQRRSMRQGGGNNPRGDWGQGRGPGGKGPGNGPGNGRGMGGMGM